MAQQNYSLRLTTAERAALDRAASRTGKNVAEYIRGRLFSDSLEGGGSAEILARLDTLESRLSGRISETVEAHVDALGARQKKLIEDEFQTLKSGLQTGLKRLAEMIQVKGGK